MTEAATHHGDFPEAETAADIARNVAAVEARIASACERVGREPKGVRLLPVSKSRIRKFM